MPKRCVAANCSNITTDSIRLFRFPKEESLRRQWTAQVKRTRADWSGPTVYTFLCSEHFTPDCFCKIASVRESLGFGAKNSRNLNPDAVPTIFHREIGKETHTRSNTAVEKREKIRVRVCLHFARTVKTSTDLSLCGSVCKCQFMYLISISVSIMVCYYL